MSTDDVPVQLGLGPHDASLLRAAVAASCAGGQELLVRYRTPASGQRTKLSSVDLVSDADLASEAAIVRTLRAHRPDDAILSEEGGGESRGRSDVQWVVDPLDGTHNYLRAIPLWCVSVAARDHAGVRVGVVADPLHDETFVAVRGHGAWLNGIALEAASDATETDAMILGGSCRRAVPAGDSRSRVLDRFVDGFGSTREIIAAALELAWTAARRIDVVYHESKIQEWDNGPPPFRWTRGD